MGDRARHDVLGVRAGDRRGSGQRGRGRRGNHGVGAPNPLLSLWDPRRHLHAEPGQVRPGADDHRTRCRDSSADEIPRSIPAEGVEELWLLRDPVEASTPDRPPHVAVRPRTHPAQHDKRAVPSADRVQLCLISVAIRRAPDRHPPAVATLLDVEDELPCRGDLLAADHQVRAVRNERQDPLPRVGNRGPVRILGRAACHEHPEQDRAPPDPESVTSATTTGTSVVSVCRGLSSCLRSRRHHYSPPLPRHRRAHRASGLLRSARTGITCTPGSFAASSSTRSLDPTPTMS